MMIKRKKSIVVLLTVALSLSMMGITSKTVYAGEYSSVPVNEYSSTYKQATDSNGITWDYYKNNDGTICINGTIEPTSVMEIPSKLDGYVVTVIDKLVEVEDRSDTNYGQRGKKVNKVTIPSGIKIIRGGAFSSCPNLTEIQIPESINIIGSYAFTDTWKEAHRDSNGFVIVNGILVDGHRSSGNVTIPSNIRCIADDAFYMCDNITSVTIPSSVKRVGEEAFFRCNNLTKVTIAEGVEVVADKAFAECSKLTEAKLPQSIKELGNNAFYGDSALTSIASNSDGLIISAGVLLSAKDAHGDVSIPSNVTKIQADAFRDNENITSVKIPSSVTEIGERAFCNSSIQSANIPGSVKIISKSAFEHCTSLTDVTIEDGVESIGNDAFITCKMSKINIPDSVINIGSSAFRGCSNLSEVNFKDGTAIGSNAFQGTLWINNQTNVGNFTIVNGLLSGCDSSVSGEVVIPDGVKIIGGGAFWGNKNITSVKIPEGVTTINEGAFGYCSNISKVIIPSTLEKINAETFIGCSNLKNIEFPKNLKTIGREAFEYSGLTEVNIPDGVSIIETEAFAKCLKLSKVYIPSSVTTIGEGAFSSDLDITFTGAGAQLAKRVLASNRNSNNYVGDNSNIGGFLNAVKPGWSLINTYWYYGNSDGTKKTGWLYDGGNWYYFYESGQMVTGFVNLDGDYYYLDKSITSSIGIMKSGWQKIDGDWFYFNTNNDSGVTGMMKKGWYQVGGVWYYSNYGDGKMAYDTWIDGYYVNSSGAWVR